MNRVSKLLLGTFSLVVLTLVAGCAARGPQRTAEPVFYPPAPDPARLQFLTSFSSAEPWLQRPSVLARFVVGDTGETRGELKNPYGMAGRDGKLYICDVGAGVVHVIDIPAQRYSVLGTREQVSRPVNVTISPEGTKYVCDTGSRRIAVFGPDDRFVRHLGDSEESVPIDVALGDGELYVADVEDAELEAWSMDGELLRKLATEGNGPGDLQMPTNLALGPEGNIFVSDTELATVKKFDTEGRFQQSYGQPGDRPGYFARPKGVVVDSAGRIYVADAQWEVVQIFAPNGRLLLFFGGRAKGPEGMGLPAGLAIDRTSMPAFDGMLAEGFEAEYLLFVVNQFGLHKVGVYAFGEGPPRPEPGAEQSAAAGREEPDSTPGGGPGDGEQPDERERPAEEAD